MSAKYTKAERRKLAERVREFRRRNGFTQSDFAQVCGVSYVYVCMLENPEKYPHELQEEKIRRVEKVLKIRGNNKEED